ncbi:hypothetical protein TTHERM_00543700 (macronuclear) [Tetrahymena thermophila SB210]|uniref:Uncharacterized protein n=1 Tax=Tetrahymena thermophila (strain SB210) TaxID=312017 RepID=I7LTR9_TETTS|nr:hypothetical protein TTHERM_00543700 [Tetrahymena thermophila SB210]EAR86030.2 hypothetical protein TTHERM_00543700 [Tetrahymena thermophila SB210]|eukprot:XP_976625.2 hypothetical protein TTHERM_00543700 [Tetrahymena thermophila SB210]
MIKLLIFSRVGKTKINDQKQVKIYKKILDSIIEQINIYDIQKDILKLKMMVRMSFTIQQYAALQLCGLRIILDQNILNIEEPIQENIQMKKDLFKNSEEEGIKEKKEQSIEIELTLKENKAYVKQQEHQLNQIEQQEQKIKHKTRGSFIPITNSCTINKRIYLKIQNSYVFLELFLVICLIKQKFLKQINKKPFLCSQQNLLKNNIKFKK